MVFLQSFVDEMDIYQDFAPAMKQTKLKTLLAYPFGVLILPLFMLSMTIGWLKIKLGKTD